ncbi:6105_t:CDS:2 [Funneliformis geosporum]|uniref:6105_t:CDS:1 n=1 Tax=Funneliformis geosporum TaxID=1117311 RepID=A0A9W4T7U9_9GLOM|nr:6105_t:CDS:2 [Funneliformis geosporum]
MLFWVKYNETLTATEIYEERYVRLLPNEILSMRHSYSNAITTRLNLKSYCDIDGNINLPDHKRVVCQIESLHQITNNYKCEKLYKLFQEVRHIIVIDNDLTDLNIEWIKTLCKAEFWDWAKKMTSLPIENWKSASLICYLRKDVQGIVCALKTDFSELRIKEYHGELDLEEKARDFNNVEVSWKDLDLIAYTSTLKIGVSYTNPKFEQNSVFLIAL